MPIAVLELLRTAERVARVWGSLPGVRAVALGGSLGRIAVPAADRGQAALSGPGDIDLYVYADAVPPAADRARLVAGLGGREPALDKRFWETEDAWLDGDTGALVEVMYRSPAWVTGEIDRVLVRHEASVGYTTCIIDNVHDSVPLVDPDGWYSPLRQRTDVPYPPALCDAIVAKNHPILRGTHASYRDQLASAVRRGDTNAAIHRTAALLASYWDILFAINGVYHPGEKRLVEHAERRCPDRPADLGARIDAIGASLAPPHSALLAHLAGLMDDLDERIAAAT
jgi:hypothetical protein